MATTTLTSGADKLVVAAGADPFDGTNDAPTLGFYQGFEANAAGILDGGNGWHGNIAIHDSGDDGISTADGGQYAVFTQSDDQSDDTGPYTRFDGYRSDFVEGLTSEVKVYLKTGWANGEGFDYSVAATRADGSHLRDFIFHVTKDGSTGQLLVGASNNTNFDPRQDLGSGTPYTVSASGWFTLQHVFHNIAGQLSVDLNLIDAAGAVVFTQTLSNATDLISDVGGNRYGWFTNIDVAGGIAVDAISLGDLAGNLTETAGVTGSAAPHTVTGEIPFLDADLSDSHTVSVTPAGSAYVGQLIATVANDTTGDGEGIVRWTFSVADLLAEGETRTQTYTITVDDGHGGTATQDVTITLTGTNDAPTLGFYQGFEANAAGILDGGNGWHGNIAIHDSGDDGISTADGGQYAVFTQSDDQSDDTGPYTRFDGYRSDFVEGLTSEVKVYLKTGWANGEGFDYSVAATRADGSHLRDFIFHVTKDGSTGQLLVGASNNTNFDPRQDLGSGTPYTVSASGWFTLQHVFHNIAGQLSVDLNLIDAAGAVVFTQTLSNATDLISDVGGNRYGWFTNIDVAGGIAVDAISLGDLAGNLTETAGVTGSAAPHTVTGEIPFLDADLSDSHTVSVTPAGSAYVGQLIATVANDTTGDGEGIVRWTFSVADLLAEGETRTQTYTITVDDGHGGTATQDVTITLTGTNDAPTLGFYQGFEANAAGILDGGNGWHGNIAIHDSGDDGISTADGGQYAVFTQSDDQSDDTGPYTRFDGYRSDFVEGLTSEVKVYLKTGWANGEGFDYSVAATRADGSHLRDFIFHVTKDGSTGQLLVGASNNTNFDPRQDLGSGTPYTVSASGWFTLQHVFHNIAGQLSVDLNLIDAAGAVVFTQTLSNATDLISDVGGNRYGWFTNIDVAGGIAVDAISLGDLAGNLTETAGVTGSAAPHTVTGEIPFLDADLSDSHTVSVTPAGSAYVGQLIATVANDTTGDGEGIVRWTFSVADLLAEGETRTQTYTITVDDGHGGTATQDVTITLTGTNDAPTLGFYQGFEANAAGILDGGNGWHGNIAIHDSGDDGISTADGGQYAVFTQSDDQSDDTGPYTRFDGYRSDFVEGLTSEVKVYLKTGWANGEGFDYSVAATRADGSHLRDFIFHVTKDGSTGQLLVGASNNTNFDPRQDLGSGTPYTVSASGWFTLQHVFHNIAGQLSVDLNLIDAAGAVVFTQTLSNATDLISDVGGNRYGWFTNIDVAGGIAVDAISLGDLAGNLTETAGVTGSAAPHTVTGEIPFLDADLSDSHTVSVTPAGSAYVGQLIATVANDTTGDGEGIVRWTFSVADLLAEGETRTQTYTITVDDGHGGTATQDVTITLTGTNDAPTLGFYQGFEANAAGILDGGNGWHGNIAIHDSGDDGISTADGGQYAVFTQSDDQSDDTGPYTRFDGYRSDFVEGLTSEVKVYLKTGWANGEGFDYSVAATRADGSHLRDFIFHVTKDGSTGQLLVGASNNTNFDPRQDLGSGTPYTVSASGWFTLQHVFHNIAGQLSVDLNLIDAAGAVVFTQTLSNATDLISDVGGNRYGWFTNIDVAGGIAVDAISLGDLAGNLTETAGVTGSAAPHTVTGEIPFLDADLSDSHTVSVTPAGSAYVGQLIATVANATAGAGDGEGIVRWTFSVADAAIDFLAAGQTRTQTYTITVNDGHGGTATQDVTITLTGTNDAPTLVNAIADQPTSEDQVWSFQIPENAFSDVDGDTLTYSARLADGSALPDWVNFDAATRTFSGTPPLNFSGPLDFKVTASDGSVSASDTFTLSIAPVNDAPVITSNAGGDTATVRVAENSRAVTTVIAADAEAGQTLSYSIIGGADASKFTIGSSTGALSFVTAPNFELPTDAGGNNVYDVIVQASDGHGGIDAQAIAVSVTDVVENFAAFTFELASFAPGAGGWNSDDLYKRELADVNGDGKADIVGFGLAGVYVSLATGSGHFAAPTFELASFAPGAGGWNSDDLYKRELADVNGDGKADIVGFGLAGVYVSLATGSGHFAAPTFALASFAPGAGGWNSDDHYKRELADVNGDGKADIVGFGLAGVYVSLATGSGHFAAPTFELANFAPGAGGWISDDLYKRELADVNGDGKADIVGFGLAGVYVSLATGSGHFAAPTFELASFAPGAGGWNSDDLYKRELADVNGDGKADIVGFGLAGVYVSLATGSGHFAAPTFALASFAPGAGGWNSDDLYKRELADVNGDGKADIVGFGLAGVYESLASGFGDFATSAAAGVDAGPRDGGIATILDAGEDALPGERGSDFIWGLTAADTLTGSADKVTPGGEAADDMLVFVANDAVDHAIRVAGEDAPPAEGGSDFIWGVTAGDTLTSSADKATPGGEAADDMLVFVANDAVDRIGGFEGGAVVGNAISILGQTSFDPFAELPAAAGVIGGAPQLDITGSTDIVEDLATFSQLSADDFRFA
ncbi:VCBS domain-containing protein [Bosea sp. BIWAKO-01]|uniref:VCBS domain-containing protein n=1 Tax=Bosea sp. BIWAKO-01 TaxID=506668 RepID=UPI000853D1D5|nr:VCBS domain-containing protein [Bosea sp. BIWAKO-01]GAU86866.1 T1SS secreted agglutinin RTX [Bosea sp. BIWAKO-01]